MSLISIPGRTTGMSREHDCAPEAKSWNLRSYVQPVDGSGLPGARVTVVPGGRYQFVITGTAEDPNLHGAHACGGASLAVTDDYGKNHYFDPRSPDLMAAQRTEGWPPQPGDTWEDEKGQPWFVRRAQDVGQDYSLVFAGTEPGVAWPVRDDPRPGWELKYRPGEH